MFLQIITVLIIHQIQVKKFTAPTILFHLLTIPDVCVFSFLHLLMDGKKMRKIVKKTWVTVIIEEIRSGYILHRY